MYKLLLTKLASFYFLLQPSLADDINQNIEKNIIAEVGWRKEWNRKIKKI